MQNHKKLNLLLVQSELKRVGLIVFTPTEFERVFDVTETAARQFLYTYTQKHFFSKLRNGLYALEGVRPNLYFAANKIYQPSYVSLETALSYYGIIPETVYSITSVTSKPTRQYDALGVDFQYIRIKQAAFEGYTMKREGGSTFLMAEPEKALMDYLYLVSLGKKTLNDRLNMKDINLEKARGYARLFGRSGLEAWLDRAQALPEPEIR